jgi:glycosyltransferase involved in cell wall biosynthesis
VDDAGPGASAVVPRSPRTKVAYISYDGVGEPLGRSQVLAYLTRLAPEYDITLISFEKSFDDNLAISDELTALGIRWLPLRYHRRPPVVSTLLDVLAGVRALVAVARAGRPAVVHARSYVPALIAQLARSATGAKLLFDIRGFWADERVEGGIWPEGGILYRIAKRCERWFFSRADAIVTLTRASIPQIREWLGPRDVEIDVIPTCVDLDRFSSRPARDDGPHAVWSGSIGTWYRFDLAAPAAQALSMPLTVLSRQTELAASVLDGYPAAVRSVAPEEVPSQLFAGDVGLCLIRSSFSKTASAPTRFAEYLATGMPVLVTRGVGDLEAIVTDDRVGVVLRSEDEQSIRQAADQVRSMAADPEVRERCRRCARARFDADAGATAYAAIYRRLTPPAAGP